MKRLEGNGDKKLVSVEWEESRERERVCVCVKESERFKNECTKKMTIVGGQQCKKEEECFEVAIGKNVADNKEKHYLEER